MIDENFDVIIGVIDELLTHHKQKVHDAIDINDWDAAMDIVNKSQNSIKQIEEWKSTLRNLQRQIHQSALFGEDINVNNATTIPAPILKEKVTSSNIFKSGSDEAEIVWHKLSENYYLKKINAFKYGSATYEIKSLTDAYVKICELMYERDHKKFLRFISELKSQGKTQYFFNSSQGYYSVKMTNADIYISVNNSNNMKTDIIEDLLRMYNLPHDYIMLSISVK